MIAFGILLAAGLDFWLRWLPLRVRRITWAILIAGLLGMSAYTLVVLLPASYNAPAPVAAIPPSAQPLDLSFGDDEPIRLLGIEVGDGRYHRGERVPVTLYWQADQQLDQDYQLFIQFLDEKGMKLPI